MVPGTQVQERRDLRQLREENSQADTAADLSRTGTSCKDRLKKNVNLASDAAGDVGARGISNRVARSSLEPQGTLLRRLPKTAATHVRYGYRCKLAE